MNVDDLKLFLEVARHGSFAAAARARRADPSAISRAVASLEQHVGARLFRRTTRSVALTEAGTLLLARVAPVIDELEAACDDARAVVNGPAGTLRMTSSHAFAFMCLNPLLPELRALFPKLTLDLVLSDASLDLVAERIDLAVRLAANPSSGLVGTKLFDTHYRVCASPSYLAHGLSLDKPQALSAHRCLLFPFADFNTAWTFQLGGKGDAQVVGVAGDLITSSALTLRSCAIAGMGPSLLPHWLIDRDIEAGALIDVFPDYRVTATPFEPAAWLVYPTRRHVPGKVRAVSEFLRRRLKRHALLR